MKSIQIHECKNGWIVTDLNNWSDPTTGPNRSGCHVFNTVEALQAALPDLLQPPMHLKGVDEK